MTAGAPPFVDYFAVLVSGLHAQPNRKGEVYTKCPQCGKEDQHFSFSERGALCFVCGFKPSLRKLCDLLLGGQVIANVERPAQAPAKPRPWQDRALTLAVSFAETPGTVAAWQSYKPLPADVIARRRLGLGILPSSQCNHKRLIVPLFDRGQVTGFWARAIACKCPKWLGPAGTKKPLYNAAYIRRGQPLTVVENAADALLVEAGWGESAVATLGAASWKGDFSPQVREAGPSMVVVAFDNDDAGRIATARLIEKLDRDGIRAVPFDWSLYPGYKDVGEFFQAEAQ